MTTKQHLGVIERVELREIWSNEPQYFTQWLADNISELGKALQMDLDLEAREAPVGAFSLDLLARDGADRKVAIENQLERTDHDHLGKLITYAAGCNVKVIVWIARELREEHRQALDWLNQHSDENTEYFGIEIEVWKIGESDPAPHFNLVVTPNEWQRAIRNPPRDLTDKQRRYQIYFTALLEALREIGFTGATKGQPQSYYFFASGHGTQFTYVASFTWDNKARVELYIDFGQGKKDQNKQLFDAISLRKNSIESQLEEKLSWERLDDARASRIALYRDGNVRIEDEDSKLEEVRTWMVEKLVAFKNTFNKDLDEYELDESQDVGHTE